MKTPLIAFFCLLTFVVAGWSLKSVLENRPAPQASAPVASRQTDLSPTVVAPISAPAKPASVSSTAKTASPVRPQNLPSPAQYSAQPPPYARPATPAQKQRIAAGPPESLPRTQASGGSSSTTTTPYPPSLAPSLAPYSSVAPNSAQRVSPTFSDSSLSGADDSVLEVDPGVPLPAALVTPDETQTPAVAAAQQQIVDSFAEAVDAALSDPATSNDDGAVNEAYFDSLGRSNERYRALYGDAAYNRQSMKATMEALSGN